MEFLMPGIPINRSKESDSIKYLIWKYNLEMLYKNNVVTAQFITNETLKIETKNNWQKK